MAKKKVSKKAPRGANGKATSVDIPVIDRLKRDLRGAAKSLGIDEVRYLVDLYYQMQQVRVGTGNQISAMGRSGEPVAVIQWARDSMLVVEDEIKKALDIYTDHDPMGIWAKGVRGIGPVLAAGLLAHIDLAPWRCEVTREDISKKHCTEKEPHPGCGRRPLNTVGGIWRFAGLDPTSKWDKGKRRPWNAALKVLCYKTGESFVKQQRAGFYGQLFARRKAEEWSRNLRGEFAEQARDKASIVGKGTQAYRWYAGKVSPSDVRILLQGDETEKLYTIAHNPAKADQAPMLPPAHIHARARRFVVKVFLYHWFAEAYKRRYGKEAPKPYVIEHLGHADFIEAPHVPEEQAEARATD